LSDKAGIAIRVTNWRQRQTAGLRRFASSLGGRAAYYTFVRPFRQAASHARAISRRWTWASALCRFSPHFFIGLIALQAAYETAIWCDELRRHGRRDFRLASLAAHYRHGDRRGLRVYREIGTMKAEEIDALKPWPSVRSVFVTPILAMI
jgi:hypothetical protein